MFDKSIIPYLVAVMTNKRQTQLNQQAVKRAHKLISRARLLMRALGLQVSGSGPRRLPIPRVVFRYLRSHPKASAPPPQPLPEIRGHGKEIARF